MTGIILQALCAACGEPLSVIDGPIVGGKRLAMIDPTHQCKAAHGGPPTSTTVDGKQGDVGGVALPFHHKGR